MDLMSTYLMMNYLSGLNSTSSTNYLSSLYSTGGSSSASGLSGTLSFLQILQALQNSSQSSVAETSSSDSASGSAADTFSSTYGNYTSQLSAGSSMDAIFDRAAARYDVDADLLKAIAKCESNFNASAVSSAGAMGVMQLMPGTARSLGVSDPYDAEQNIMGGAKYISQMLERYDGDVELALAAYNAGPGNVDKYDGIPPFKETQNYVERVMSYLEEDNSPVVTADAENAASSAVSSSSGSDTIEIKTDTLITLYNLMRAQMELQLANSMFAWNNDDSSDSSLLSL